MLNTRSTRVSQSPSRHLEIKFDEADCEGVKLPYSFDSPLTSPPTSNSVNNSLCLCYMHGLLLAILLSHMSTSGSLLHDMSFSLTKTASGNSEARPSISRWSVLHSIYHGNYRHQIKIYELIGHVYKVIEW